jgi:predicted MFS family arabinose efflux permease
MMRTTLVLLRLPRMSTRLVNSLPLWGSFATNGLGMFAAGLMMGAFPWFWFSSGGSATTAGFIAAAFHGGAALGLLTGGVLIDRLGPRPVLLSTDLASAVAFAAACASLFLSEGSVWPTVAFVALGLMLGAPGNVAQDSRVPALARLAGMPLGRANGLRDLTSQLGQVIGPIAGVLLVEIAGLATVLFLVSAILLLVFMVDVVVFPAFRRTEADTAQGDVNPMAYIVSNTGLKVIIMLAVLLISALSAINNLIGPLLAIVHDVGATGLSVFFGVLGAGVLLSILSYSSFGYRYDGRLLLFFGFSMVAVGLFLISLPMIVGFYAGALVLGFGLGPLWPIVLGAVQRTVPLTLRAGVIGLLGGAVLIAQPIASATVGGVVDAFGPSTTILGFAVVIGCATLIASRSQGLFILVDVKLEKRTRRERYGTAV